MVARILKPLFQKLYKKLNLSSATEANLYMGETCVPIVDIDKVLCRTNVQRTSATGTTRTDVYTCPVGKYWLLKTAAFSRDNAGSFQILASIRGQATYAFPVGASATSYFTELYNIKLEEGDSISLAFNSGTSGNLSSDLLYEEYDA